jgi:hypothetical protein
VGFGELDGRNLLTDLDGGGVLRLYSRDGTFVSIGNETRSPNSLKGKILGESRVFVSPGGTSAMFAYRDRFTIWNRKSLKWATFRIRDLSLETRGPGIFPPFKPRTSAGLSDIDASTAVFDINVDWVSRGVVLTSPLGALFVDESFKATLLGGRFSSDPDVASDVLNTQWAAQLGKGCGIDPKFRVVR